MVNLEVEAPFFLAVQTRARPDWEQYFLEPTPSKACKSDEAKATDVANKKQAQAELSPISVISGTMITGVLLDRHGESVISVVQSLEDVEGAASYEFMDGLANLLYAHQLPHDNEYCLLGRHIRDKLRLMALDANRYCTLRNANQLGQKLSPIAFSQWSHRTFEHSYWADPYELLIPSDMKGDVDYAGLCDFLNVSVPTDLDHADPQIQADVWRRLSLAGGLCS